MIIKDCRVCNRALKFYKSYKLCANLGCTQYNKKHRRYDASKQKRKKEKIQCQEEE